MAPLVDGIIIVVDPEKTSLKEVKEAMGLIPKEKFLGFVLNRHETTSKEYYDYYGGRSKVSLSDQLN
jgi:Mrp family chromosome partitioning ATPase